MNLQKQKPFRSEKYKKWIRTLPCCMSGRTDNIVPHHLISCGLGGVMGDKVSDLFTIPMNAEEHRRFHDGETRDNIDQKAEALRTIEKAIHSGVLKID